MYLSNDTVLVRLTTEILAVDDFRRLTHRPHDDWFDRPGIYLNGNPKVLKRLRRRQARAKLKQQDKRNEGAE